MIWWDKNHLESSSMSFFQHMNRAIRISCLGLRLSIVSLIHAFFPSILPCEATRTAEELIDVLHKKE